MLFFAYFLCGRQKVRKLVLGKQKKMKKSYVDTYLAKADEAKETVRQLAHAAMQNQKIEMSELLSLLNHEGIQEAEETLKVAEKKRFEREQASSFPFQKRDEREFLDNLLKLHLLLEQCSNAVPPYNYRPCAQILRRIPPPFEI